MPKSLSDFLSKKKNKPIPQQTSNSANETLSSSTSWLLCGCRHPKTPSFSSVDRKEKNVQGENDAATLADVDSFLFENFKSFYYKGDDKEAKANTSEKPTNKSIVKRGKGEEIVAANNEEIASGQNSSAESPRYNTFLNLNTSEI